MYGSHSESQINLELDRLGFVNEICADRMDEIIALSKSATYRRVINNSYAAYQKDMVSRDSFKQTLDAELQSLYSRQDAVQTVNFWVTDEKDPIRSGVYSEKSGGSYREVQAFWSDQMEDMKEIAKDLGTRSYFYLPEDGGVYLIRNMLDSSYQVMGVIVIRLNEDYCFGNLTKMEADTDVTIQIDDAPITIEGTELTWQDVRAQGAAGMSGYLSQGRHMGMYNVQKRDDYTLSTLVRHRNVWPNSIVYSYRLINLGLVVLLIPMLVFVLYLFRKNFTEPVNSLVNTVKQIRDGNLGYQEKNTFNVQEFSYLEDSINDMSVQLKAQFDHIYEEEIALRDARIMALQSHINPHFLNNTLEIINWEARLNGDEKVAEMIGSLSILTDAAMDRRKRSIVPMSEEMEYVNAYLDILKMRFGKRLTVINEFPPEITDIPVPRLILQPIIENAVEHGAAKHGDGTVILRAHQDEKYLYLNIYNDGGITQEERDKIERLLAPDYDTSKESSGSLGIANVNQRLRILYGEPCGLTIGETEEGEVVTQLIIAKRY